MKKNVWGILLVICLLFSLAGCREKTTAESVNASLPTMTKPAETVPETTVPPTEPTQPLLLKDNVDGKVCVGFLPTEAGAWRYVVIEDQEAAVAAFEKAVGAIYSDEWWIKGDRTRGLTVVYNGEFWDFVESGELVYALGRVKAEDAADLYALCADAAREAGWQEAVTPEQLVGLRAATLRVSGKQFPLTDSASLEQLEAMLISGKYALGGTGCPFTAWLDLELETGEVRTIVLATDSCGVWMSEGYYYDYGSDSQPLFDLFGVTLKFGELAE